MCRLIVKIQIAMATKIMMTPALTCILSKTFSNESFIGEYLSRHETRPLPLWEHKYLDVSSDPFSLVKLEVMIDERTFLAGVNCIKLLAP